MKTIANPPGAGGWPTAFIGLTDVPATYVGQAGKVATVNPGETGLIFSTAGGGGGTGTVTSVVSTDGSATLGASPTTVPDITVVKAPKLSTARTIAGVSFDGTANIAIDHTGLTSIGTNTHAQIDTALTRLANTSGTNTGDNAVNTLYSGLVSNATHTGDATGSTALTVVKINGTLMSGLATGILKNTIGTGVPSIATGADLPVMTATVGGAVPTPPNNTTTFLRGDGTFATPAGSGDMVLASAQTNSGAKTFLDATLLLRNVANTISSKFTNTATVARTWTMKDADGTVAFTSDITGTNSGTNTGDVSLAGTPSYITIAGQVITRALIDLTTHVTGLLPFANIANVATSTVMYRKTAGAGAMEAQTLATLKTDLALTGTNSGDVTLTTTGTSGAATLVGQVLNIPQYSGGGGGTTITTQDEGSTLSTTVTTLNFTGAGVTASGSGATTTIDIPGGAGGGLTLGLAYASSNGYFMP